MKLVNLLSFAVFFVAGQSILTLQAQVKQTPVQYQFAEIAAIQKQKDQTNMELTLKLAAQKKWPYTMKGTDGRMALLAGVDEWGYPIYTESESNLVAATTIGTNQLWTGGGLGLNLTGANTLLKDKVAIWDGGGVNATHQELTGRIVPKDAQSSADGHATHVAGTMIAKGISSFAKGMAFNLPNLISYTFSGHLGEMTTEAPNLLVSNHSYGTIAGWRFNTDQSRWEWYGQFGTTEDFKFGYYNSEAQLWDSLSFMSPNYLIVKSSGNNRNEAPPSTVTNYWRYNAQGVMADAGSIPEGISRQNGFDLLPTYSNAKNILTVGNILPIPNGYAKPSDVQLANSSSVGPTDDGRIKPDIVANGTNVTSTYTGSNTAYATLSGTSMSGPTVAGSSVLLQELYMQKNETPAWSSTIRGLVIHTANKATTTPGPDYRHGWGVANFAGAASVIDNKNGDALLQQRTLNNAEKHTISVIASGRGPLKVSICWTDPPATVNTSNPLNDRTKKLVHDLDIRVKRGNRTFLPWKLDFGFPTLPATRDDNDVDNVEVIELDSTLIGETYTIEVTHKGTLTRTGTQAYTLIATGVGGKAYAASAASSSAGSRIDSVSIGGITNQNTAGCKTYSDFRTRQGQAEIGQSLPFYVKVNSCDASNATRFARIFMDFNNDGDFNDAGETVASSFALTNDGIFAGFISVPNTLTIGTSIYTRIVLTETSAATNINPTGSYPNGETQDYQLSITAPSNDLAMGQVLYPEFGECGNSLKNVTIRLRNMGTVARTRIPVEVEVRKGLTLVTTLRDTCKVSLAGQSETDFTLQPTFLMEANTTYNFVARVNIQGDQLTANNERVSEITTSSPGAAPTDLTGVVCNGTEVRLKANTTNGRISWFTSATAASPFTTSTTGATITTNQVTADKRYFAATNDIRGSVGPVNKMVFPSGGYNEFNGNFVRFSTQVPILIESVRMYTGNPGKINIILADIVSENGTGGYSYRNRGQRTFQVTNSRPTAQAGVLTENNPADTGFIYNLNFQVTEPGNFVLIMQCTEGATIYRNNNIPLPGPYPLQLNGNSNLFTFTGNSVVSPSDPNNFYYFFYDMKVSTLEGCPSPRVPITVANNVLPVISQNGNTLSSSLVNGNQWRLNGTDIAGANQQQFIATTSGLYRVANTDPMGCIGLSNELNVVVTSVNNVDPAKIGLLLAPNPNRGLFNVQFRVKGREQLDIAVLNISGQQVYRQSYDTFSGDFNQNIQLPKVAPGIYMLKVTHGKDHYLKRILID